MKKAMMREGTKVMKYTIIRKKKMEKMTLIEKKNLKREIMKKKKKIRWNTMITTIEIFIISNTTAMKRMGKTDVDYGGTDRDSIRNNNEYH